MKPAELILGFAAQQAQPDELANARRTLLANYQGTFGQIAYHVEATASLAAKWGIARLLEGFPPEQQQAFRDSLAAIRTCWEAVSPFPFPVISEQPVPVEPTE